MNAVFGGFGQAMNEKEYEAGLPTTPGYRYAKLVGAQLYIAGQTPTDSEGKLVGTDSYTQAQACLSNLATLLRCHSLSQNDIQQITIYVVGPQPILAEAWRAVREQFSDKVPPATLLGVAALGFANQIVEIDATIVREPGGS